jgi:hypothetical protein
MAKGATMMREAAYSMQLAFRLITIPHTTGDIRISQTADTPN